MNQYYRQIYKHFKKNYYTGKGIIVYKRALKNFSYKLKRKDNSITRRDFIKLHYQQGAQLNKFDQIIETTFGEISNYHQVGNA